MFLVFITNKKYMENNQTYKQLEKIGGPDPMICLKTGTLKRTACVAAFARWTI